MRPVSAVLALSLLAALLSSCEWEQPSAQSAPGVVETNPEIVNKYVSATRTQQATMRGGEMEVNIDAKLPSLEKQGRLQALRKISRLGQITYKALGFSGDSTVKQEVIARYLAAESEARDSGAIAITPANYKFKYKGRYVSNSTDAQILQVTPKRKAVGLFKGEIWVDAQTGMPLRESGEFVKTPSVFLRKIEFVRNYEMHDGVSFPTRIESTVDTRLVGKAELKISFSNFKPDEAQDDAGSGPGGESGNQTSGNLN